MALGFTSKGLNLTSVAGVTSAVGLNVMGLLKKGQFVDLDADEVLKFMFNPHEIAKDKASKWETIDVLFRSHPKYQWKSGGATVYKMELYLNSIATAGQDVVKLFPISHDVAADVRFLHSLQYPLEDAGLANRRPPRVRFRWPGLANVPIIVMNVSTIYKKFNLFLEQQVAAVTVTFHVDSPDSLTSEDVRGAGDTGVPGLVGLLGDDVADALGALGI